MREALLKQVEELQLATTQLELHRNVEIEQEKTHRMILDQEREYEKVWVNQLQGFF
jgi:hypothetical protein